LRTRDHHKRKLGIAYYRHFYPVVKRIRQIIDDGEIGTTVIAQMNAFEWFDPHRGPSPFMAIEEAIIGWRSDV
jgi:predicted dehydrogenase